MTYFPDKLTFAWIKNSYENGSMTPRELAQEIVRRSEYYRDYNIWITKPAMEQMSPYLNALPENKGEHPLWGIPFAIKDNIDLKDVPTTAACKDYEYIPTEHAAVVERLIASGAIPVGKTNLDQFATGLVGTRSPFGEVHNALNPELISGGSSSGSAVCVALGMAAFSLGTDTAGSGRIPAALNGLVGYKPSLGAWSTRGVVPACASLDCVTVFANNLEDAKTVNFSARGEDGKSPWSRVYDVPVPAAPKKICLLKDGLEFFGPYADIYRKKWKQAESRLNSCGIEVEYIDGSMFRDAASILYDGPWVAERWKDLGGFVESHTGKVFPVTETILRSGAKSQYTAGTVFEAMHKLQEYRWRAKKILRDAVLVMPTAGGTFTRDEVRENPIETNSQMGLYTNHCNLLDLCAVNIPENTADHKLPFGITIFGKAEEEGLILGMAESFLRSEKVPLAVCGLHKKGYPLESQLVELGADYAESTRTAPEYKLYELNTVPVKPGMVKDRQKGTAVAVDIYRLPVDKMGAFMRQVRAPLAIGDVQLQDGTCVKGFLCEEYAVADAKDITDIGAYERTD